MKFNFTKPQVMGILNITPDSFSEIGRHMSVSAALQYAQQMVNDGATIIDVGGESTNPSVHPIISLQEELDRVMPVIEALKKNIDVLISLDTSKPEVMQQALKCGINMINDVRALSDEQALQFVARANIPVCLMHMAYPQGVKNIYQQNQIVENIVKEVKNFLSERIKICLTAGIAKENIIIDPGIGTGNFGKNLKQNLQLLNHLPEFLDLGYPILVSASRKTFIGELLNLSVADRLYGSLAAAVISVSKGANIIRTHDVKPTVEAIKMTVAVLEEKI